MKSAGASLDAGDGGAVAARHRALVRFHEALPVADQWASTLHDAMGAPLPLEELRSYAWEGLWNAITTFRAEGGQAFDVWIRWRVLNTLIDALREHGILARRGVLRAHGALTGGDDFERATVPADVLDENRARLAVLSASFALGATEDREVFAVDAPSAEDLVHRVEQLQAVRRAIAAMDDARERDLLTAYFIEQRVLKDAGALVGLETKGGASRMLQRALASLRQALLRGNVIGLEAFQMAGAWLNLDRNRRADDDEAAGLDAPELADVEAEDNDDEDAGDLAIEHAIADPWALLRLLGGGTEAPRARSSSSARSASAEAPPRRPASSAPPPVRADATASVLLREGETLAGRVGHGVVIRRRSAAS